MNFDEKTILELGYYVYMLVDPENNKPFYIGKGHGNRVFNHVSMCLKDEDYTSLKYDKIKEIGSNNVIHIIIRHGLKEDQALVVESTCIDLLQFLQYPLTNIQSGNKSMYKGLMSVNEVRALYSAQSLDYIEPDCMIININSSYNRIRKESHRIPTQQDIYHATKGVWSMAIGQAEKKKYVLSVFKGLVVEVFTVDKWYQEKRDYQRTSKKHGNSKRLGCAFEGRVAEDEIRNRYINKSIKHKILKGSSLPFRYTL